ncbi:MAG: fosfomycin resistance glutathione transferase [Edaphobacter sp.]|uniref:fosfomycin resistance glutathione transferase n=1 Tax=Edaphobacter sp. TaxID=1934404 RepID=UPI00239C7438|nr:fosfomycin resistance glutathione transferase [Edaphobacter sp.]MDE1176605.1 fosfomycin resistance glutathione transferase [Edaphobacter sp.]
MIGGINHITLAVRDLEISFSFYTDVLGLRPVAKWYKGAYLEAGTDWICLTLDESTRSGSLPEYTHLALTVDEAEFAAAMKRLQDAGAECWQQNHSEGESYYFLDPNGHKLEIHTGTLQSRLATMMEHPPRDLILFPSRKE